MSETVESRLQDLLGIERERNRQMEEEIEALHIALRASGERREKAEGEVSELEQRHRQMEEALEEIVRAHENPTRIESFRGELDGGRLVGIAERGLARRSREPNEATEPEDTSEFYLDSFHRTWNREF